MEWAPRKLSLLIRYIGSGSLLESSHVFYVDFVNATENVSFHFIYVTVRAYKGKKRGQGCM